VHLFGFCLESVLPVLLGEFQLPVMGIVRGFVFVIGPIPTFLSPAAK
jgi:hypothetical protein